MAPRAGARVGRRRAQEGRLSRRIPLVAAARGGRSTLTVTDVEDRVEERLSVGDHVGELDPTLDDVGVLHVGAESGLLGRQRCAHVVVVVRRPGRDAEREESDHATHDPRKCSSHQSPEPTEEAVYPSRHSTRSRPRILSRSRLFFPL